MKNIKTKPSNKYMLAKELGEAIGVGSPTIRQYIERPEFNKYKVIDKRFTYILDCEFVREKLFNLIKSRRAGRPIKSCVA